MAISPADVKKLREMTGAGVLDCKKALEEFNGDFAAAEKHLKEKGLAAVEKRSDRATNQGKVFVKQKDNEIALAEVLAETDFVARNPEFIAVGENIVERMLEKGYTEIQPELSELVSNLAIKIGENMTLKRVKLVKSSAEEYLTYYIHGDGAIGVVVKLGSSSVDSLKQEEAKKLAHDLALHIAAFEPLALDKSHLDPAFVKEQEDIFRAQMQNDEEMTSKPANVQENILKGKVNKFVKESCLVDQAFVKDETLSVAKALEECGKKLGASLKIVDYVYLKVGQ